MSKVTILDEQESSVQPADRTIAVQVWIWGNMYLPKPGDWPLVASVPINSGCHAGENPPEETLSESSQVRDYMK